MEPSLLDIDSFLNVFSLVSCTLCAWESGSSGIGRHEWIAFALIQIWLTLSLYATVVESSYWKLREWKHHMMANGAEKSDRSDSIRVDLTVLM